MVEIYGGVYFQALWRTESSLMDELQQHRPAERGHGEVPIPSPVCRDVVGHVRSSMQGKGTRVLGSCWGRNPLSHQLPRVLQPHCVGMDLCAALDVEKGERDKGWNPKSTFVSTLLYPVLWLGGCMGTAGRRCTLAQHCTAVLWRGAPTQC